MTARALSSRRRALGFIGPALLVSVGYIDPGNWATDLEGGARFGYALLWVLIASSLMAVILQSFSARLGIASGLDLAQACRASYSRPVNLGLWALAELGIIACDSAEVIGSALALNMLFGVPLLLGAVLTALDVLLILLLQNRRLAVLELLVGGLLLIVAGCLAVEVLLAAPSASEVLSGASPTLPPGSLYIAIGVLGATLMPHNLYLQSSVARQDLGQSRGRAIRRSWWSTLVALNLALLMNIAILVLSASAFGSRGMVVADLRDAHQLLSPLLGSSIASALFAIALLCSGQSATITGTMAGQIVMEGFLQTRLSPVVRRAVTRLAAVVPAVVVLSSLGEGGAMRLLIGSQVVLSLQLPFAIVPLLRFTGSGRLMGRYANTRLASVLAAGCALAVIGANAVLLWKTERDLREWSALAGNGFVAVCVSGAAFLAWIWIVPLRPSSDVIELGAASSPARS